MSTQGIENMMRNGSYYFYDLILAWREQSIEYHEFHVAAK